MEPDVKPADSKDRSRQLHVGSRPSRAKTAGHRFSGIVFALRAQTRSQTKQRPTVAGMAIENSMLGAAHASANPLTAKFDVVHGHAVALMLAEVMRWNREERSATAVYLELAAMIQEPLVEWVEQVIGLANLPSMAECGVTKEALPGLAADAAVQWTGQFNPRPLTVEDFESLYGRVLVATSPVAETAT